MLLNGFARLDVTGGKYVYENYPFINGTGETPNRGLLPEKSGWLLDLIAGTNPSRPVFTPPQFLQDLIELPKLLRETGKLLAKPQKLFSPREAANAHLAARFGWLPLIDDLSKLLDLQSHILKRNRELQNLYSGEGLRRRIQFNESTAVYKGVFPVALYGPGLISVDVHTVVKKKQWGTIRWKPKAPPPFLLGDEAINAFARRLVLGLTVEGMAKGAWDVIPWTWLLGWFTNIGKYTLLHSNTVPASWSDACLMNQVLSTSTPGIVTVAGCKSYKIEPDGFFNYEWRTRTTGSVLVAPGLNMPYLDISRLSVLASLFIQRLKR